MKTKLIILPVLVSFLTGCDDYLLPADENNRKLEDIYTDAAFAEGLLMNGYVRLPNGGYSFTDVATDDAVSNDPNRGYRQMAGGKWSALNNPVERWAGAFAAIQYLNIILEETDKWNGLKLVSMLTEMFNDRTKVKTYGLQKPFMYYCFRHMAGLQVVSF